MKLVLGTAQFAGNYGVTSKLTRHPAEGCAQVLTAAKNLEISAIDTAVNYSGVEALLGSYNVDAFKVITKLPPCGVSYGEVNGWVRNIITSSMTKLGVRSLYGVLLHRAEDWLSQKGSLVRALVELKEEGVVENVGVSIYEPDLLEELQAHQKLDLIQAPYNLLDRRLEKSGWLQRLHDQGVIVHTRSIFLQGLLLARSSNLPPSMAACSADIVRVHKYLLAEDLDAVAASLSIASNDPRVDGLVVGVETPSQLGEVALAFKHSQELELDVDFSSYNLDLIDPRRWKK